MAVPKQKHTKSRRNKRRTHYYLKPFSLSRCPRCGKFKRPHMVCSFCGYYREKEIIDVSKKEKKKEAKK
jgi:large subunit ribosomal protein L32